MTRNAGRISKYSVVFSSHMVKKRVLLLLPLLLLGAYLMMRLAVKRPAQGVDCRKACFESHPV